MRIIAISGKVGSGKDTLAGILTRLLNQRGFSVESFAFADRLKRAIAYMRNEDEGLYYSREGKDGGEAERRQLLENVGKAACSVDKSIFIRSTYKDMSALLKGKHKKVAIITDLRLLHEYNHLITDDVNEVSIIRIKGSFSPCPDEKVANANSECDLDFLDEHLKEEARMFIHQTENLAVGRPYPTKEELCCSIEEAESNKIKNINMLDTILDMFEY